MNGNHPLVTEYTKISKNIFYVHHAYTTLSLSCKKISRVTHRSFSRIASDSICIVDLPPANIENTAEHSSYGTKRAYADVIVQKNLTGS